jgi:hypothetical protein
MINKKNSNIRAAKKVYIQSQHVNNMRIIHTHTQQEERRTKETSYMNAPAGEKFYTHNIPQTNGCLQ